MGNVITIPSKDIRFEYRKNNLPDDLIFLSASFKGKKGNREDIVNKTNELKRKRIKINQQELRQVEVHSKILFYKQKKSGSL